MTKNQLKNSTNCHGGESGSKESEKDKIRTGDFIQVIDNKTGKVIIQGEIKYKKIFDKDNHEKTYELEWEECLYSIDNKYFFKVDDEKYSVKKLNQFFVDENFIEENYSLTKWKAYSGDKRKNTNMFIENPVSGLDKEVEGIVHTLNSFSPSVQTIGSCSGHGKISPWISLIFSDSSELNNFLDIFEAYKSKMDLTTDPGQKVEDCSFNGKTFFPKPTTLNLVARGKGEPAYETLDSFDRYLKRAIRLRERSNELLEEFVNQERNSVISKVRAE